MKLSQIALGGLLVRLSHALPSLRLHSKILRDVDVESHLITDPAQVADKHFDYVIAGGGLTGLTAAARLSEDSKISVLVIESGYWESDQSTHVTDLTHYGKVFNTAIDHQFVTEPLDVTNRSEIVHSGQGLGGSTLINGGTWTRPHKSQIDAWESVFSNKGWSWDAMLPYMLKIENARLPDSEEEEAGMYMDESCHGTNGSIRVGARNTGEKFSPIMKALMSTAGTKGIPTRKDLSCGEPHGVSMFPNDVTQNQVRCDAGREMLLPNIQRPNLHILVGQKVGKVHFDTGASPPKATGVEFGRHRTLTYNVHADHEVLLAAGSSVSPLILEYSGVGLQEVLDAASVKQIVELPVGLNQQDQTTTAIRNRANAAGAGQGQAAFFATFNETFGSDADRALALLRDDSTLQQWADAVVAGGGFHNATALMVQYRNYVDLITQHDVAYAELFLDTYGAISFDIWNLLPFSRGYIHIASPDPYLGLSKNNPRYMMNELDVLGQAAATRLGRDLSSDGDMGLYWAGETLPSYEAVAENADLDAWAGFVKGNFRANYHAVATCSMMARELGGVVDNAARVYDTQGLRVIDGSIPPTQVSSHVMTVFYGMAEKISDAILEDYYKVKN